MLTFQIIRALNRHFVTTAMLKKQRLMTKYWLKTKHQYYYIFGGEGNN